jgi:hypothetical protein
MSQIDEYTVDVDYLAQPDQKTCWNASYKMMLKYKKKVESLADSLPNDTEMRDRGILDSEFLSCRTSLGLSSTSYSCFKKAEDILAKLQTYGPIWVSGTYCDGHKHIVVLRGVREGYFSKPEVYVNDPYRGMTGAAARPAWWSLSYFAANLNPVAYACQHWL